MNRYYISYIHVVYLYRFNRLFHLELEIGFSEKTFFICKVDFFALKIKFSLYSNKAIKNRLINLGIIQVGLRILKLTVHFRSVNIFGPSKDQV